MTRVEKPRIPPRACELLRLPFLIFVLTVSSGLTLATDERYHDHGQLTAALRAMAAAHPGRCTLSSICQSRAGRDVWVVRVAASGHRDPENRPALLVVAGVAGDELTGSAIVLGELRRVLEPAQPDPELDKLLATRTLYLLPRLNPDAAESFFGAPRFDRAVVLRPTDDDGDGTADEDGPEDINGDGTVTLMRVQDAEKADMLPDPAEPRLLKKADAAKGERPIYKLYAEGLDNDGDEQFNEDPPGGVELHHNFPHGYREHAATSGPYPLCEAESKALVDFLIAHPRIAVVIEYGVHDNVIETPKGEKKDAAGAPVDLHADDVAMYRELGEKFRKLTELKNPPKFDAAGAFFAWAYAQFGVPALAVSAWPRPEVPKDEHSVDNAAQPAESSTQPTDRQPAEIQPTSAPATEPVTLEQVEEGLAQLIAHERGADKQDKNDDEDKPDPDDKDAAAWLVYSDKLRSGEGFMAWTPFEHPQLGPVEIGGFVPFFRTTPPERELPALIDQHFKFLLDVATRFPSIGFEQTRVTSLGPGVFEIETLLVNSGYFPTATAMGVQNRRVRPVVVTLDLPLDRIMGGERVTKVWSLPGSGGRQKFRWVVLGTIGERVKINLTSEKLGDFPLDVVLQPTG